MVSYSLQAATLLPCVHVQCAQCWHVGQEAPWKVSQFVHFQISATQRCMGRGVKSIGE